jgi:GDP-D-mannose 3',5'-epimerase
MRVLCTGGQGFIGHHLVRHLKQLGHWVRCVDWKDEGYRDADEFILLDLRFWENCLKATKDIDAVFGLAADMGGMGFIQDKNNQALILYNNTLINFHMLEASRINGVKKYLYSSSACVYPEYKQTKLSAKLKEEDAYPAMPQDTYGWEKLQAEHLCLAYQNYGMDTKIVRFHNIYGPEGTFEGGREKAPAALCRKVITAIKNGDKEIEIWGDGKQTRSFCYIDDCLKAIMMVFNSDLRGPVNIGRDDSISINNLAKLVMKVSGKKLKIRHIDGPLGVRGRNSDNTKFKQKFNWEPELTQEEGIKRTYKWIDEQIQCEK